VAKQWDKASEEIKLGAIGVLVKDDKGKIKTHKLGKRKTGLCLICCGGWHANGVNRPCGQIQERADG
jgi:hypothetical protein